MASKFSAEEREAMKERARELKAAQTREAGEKDLLSKIDEMDAADQKIAKRIHALVTEAAPQLTPKTWYGQPAWVNSEGKVVVFFQAASKFKTRYATLGFQEEAALDEGTMWATSYAVTGLTDADEKKIVSLVKKAVG